MLCFHLKLHPGIIYSHAASQVCSPPILDAYLETSLYINRNHSPTDPVKSFDNDIISPIAQTMITLSKTRHLEYKFATSVGDWKYAIDFCGGLYRFSDIDILIQKAISSSGGLQNIANPNILETSLNKAFWSIRSSNRLDHSSTNNPLSSSSIIKTPFDKIQMIQKYQISGCAKEPLLKVISINIVQSSYNVPIFKTPGGDVHSLNMLLFHSKADNSQSSLKSSPESQAPTSVDSTLIKAHDEDSIIMMDTDKYESELNISFVNSLL